LSYPTEHKAVNLIRFAIIASDKDAQEPLHGEIELDGNIFWRQTQG
jgi:hypothetical protein